MRIHTGIIPLLALVLLLPIAACGPSGDETVSGNYDEQKWAELKSAKSTVDDKRAERDDLREQLKALASGETEETEPATETETETEGAEGTEGEMEAPLTAEEIQARLDELQGEIDTLTDQLAREVPEFMNQYFEIPLDEKGRVDEAALTPVQKEAIEMKVDEDIVLAREYITKGGEYEKALNIYEQAMVLAPNYQPLVDAKAEAEANRHMSEERFTRLEKKMTQDQVRDLLGQVKRSNVRDYPEKGILGWFYRKDNGGAAGVFYKEQNQGAGDWLVYSFDFNAVEPQVIGGEEEGEDTAAEPPPEG